MKQIFLIFFLALSLASSAQAKIEKLDYAHILIDVPSNCTANSDSMLMSCNGFSVQWLGLTKKMEEQKIYEKVFDSFAKQSKYKTKIPIEFTSQNQVFKGMKYTEKRGECRILGYGKINGIPLILNLYFAKEPRSNADLKEFEKNFILFN